MKKLYWRWCARRRRKRKLRYDVLYFDRFDRLMDKNRELLGNAQQEPHLIDRHLKFLRWLYIIMGARTGNLEKWLNRYKGFEERLLDLKKFYESGVS